MAFTRGQAGGCGTQRQCREGRRAARARARGTAPGGEAFGPGSHARDRRPPSLNPRMLTFAGNRLNLCTCTRDAGTVASPYRHRVREAGVRRGPEGPPDETASTGEWEVRQRDSVNSLDARLGDAGKHTRPRAKVQVNLLEGDAHRAIRRHGTAGRQPCGVRLSLPKHQPHGAPSLGTRPRHVAAGTSPPAPHPRHLTPGTSTWSRRTSRGPWIILPASKLHADDTFAVAQRLHRAGRSFRGDPESSRRHGAWRRAG